MNSKYYQLFSALFIAALITSNIIAVKIGNFAGYFLPVAVIVFPITYIISDVLTEIYGYAAARRVIWLGFLGNILAVIAIWIGMKISPAPFFQNQAAYEQILGVTPRILGASLIAYLIGEFSNSLVLSKLKVKTRGKFLWIRTIGSTIIGQGLDSFIFITIAFWGIFAPRELLIVAATQWIFKTFFEAVCTPITYAVVGWVKKKERVDVYDERANFNPLKF